jgi:O-antigen ligase
MRKSRRTADAGTAKRPGGDLAAASVGWSSRLVFAVVALAPLPLGSIGAPASAIWSICLGMALIGLLPVRLRPAQLAVLAVAGSFAAAVLLVAHEQTAQFPWLAVDPNSLWEKSSGLLANVLQPSVSVAHNQPFFSLGLGIVCFLSFSTSLLMASDRDAARRLLWVVALSGATYAVLGIATFLIDPTKVFLLYEKQAHLASLTSPFVNRNTAAVYYGCCALVWLMLCCDRIQRYLPARAFSWARLRAGLDSRRAAPILKAALGWLVCLIAMFLTGSRAGAGASLACMIIAVAAFFHRRLPRGYGIAATLLLGVTAGLALTQLFGGAVGGRLSAQGLSDEGRMSTYRAVLRMIGDHPWLGTGFGTFEWAYPAYRTDDISLAGTWNRAHNSLLELASDGGLLIAGFAVAVAVVALVILFHGVRSRRQDVIVPVVAMCAMMAALAHSMVDFSLQIPGYAIVIFSLLGAGLSQSFRSLRAPLDPGPLPAVRV